MDIQERLNRAELRAQAEKDRADAAESELKRMKQALAGKERTEADT